MLPAVMPGRSHQTEALATPREPIGARSSLTAPLAVRQASLSGRSSRTARLAVHQESTLARSFLIARLAALPANSSGRSSRTKRLDQPLSASAIRFAITEQFHVNRASKRDPSESRRPVSAAPRHDGKPQANHPDRRCPVRPLGTVRAFPAAAIGGTCGPEVHGSLRRGTSGHPAFADPRGKPVRGSGRKGSRWPVHHAQPSQGGPGCGEEAGE